MFKKTSLFKIPIPIFGTFEEINLRFLTGSKPDSVIIAEGSPITVKWKRTSF